MEEFEKDISKKIKEQLENEKLNKEVNENTQVDEKSQQENTQVNDTKNINEVVSQNDNEDENKTSKDSIIEGTNYKKKNILKEMLGIVQSDTNHFKREDKVRPLAIISSILSFIVCAGIMAILVFALMKIIPPFWEMIVNISGVFFNEKILAFTLGIGCLFGAIVVALVGMLFLMIILLFVSLGFVTVGIPIVGFKTCKLPKQVFAYEKDSMGNMIFSYILGLLITFLGFAMFMDGSFKFAQYIGLLVGITFLVIAVLMTIDKIQCKKAFNNLTNDQEKQEIKAEARAIADAEKQRKKNRKLIGKLLGKLFKK